jgi:hypothetical protein
MSCVLAERSTSFALLSPVKKELRRGSRTVGAVWIDNPAGTPASEAARKIAEIRCRLHRPLVAALEVELPGKEAELTRLARAVAAAGADALVFRAPDTERAARAVALVYPVVTLPLIVRCPELSAAEAAALVDAGADAVIMEEAELGEKATTETLAGNPVHYLA